MAETIDWFRSNTPFELVAIFPADAPREALLAHDGCRLLLDRTTQGGRPPATAGRTAPADRTERVHRGVAA
ncbi:MAG: hypothetical protein R2715_22870 [Ilumatobacteraceae bacterium]